MKVGFFSPLPPARTGVADYSAELLRALKLLGEVDVDPQSADIALYHLGNNGLHREIYRRALEKPGVIVLHDAVLHHFFLGSLSEPEYIAEFVFNYGDWSEDLARDLWERRSRSAADPEYFQYPMLKRVVERSLGIVVHNPRAAAMVLQHAPDAVVYEIPHLFAAPAEAPAYSAVLRLRDQVGVPPRVCLFGVFGHLRESKRLASILRALQRARTGAEIALLIAGDFASRDLARSLTPLLEQDPNICRVGYLSERDFWLYAHAVDASISLRFPAAGETSGISIRLMGIGKPVLLTDSKEVSRFPADTCIRIDRGEAEEEMLAEFMVWLARFPDDARAIGQRASAYIGHCHAPDRVAGLYWQALTDCYYRI